MKHHDLFDMVRDAAGFAAFVGIIVFLLAYAPALLIEWVKSWALGVVA